MGSPLYTFLRRLHRLASREQGGGLTDADLLRRYCESRDEAAFETLVWRHGGMVLAVCRRTTRGEQDAEDAFQATFLALARSAGAITRQESVGGWLYRVASRLARRLRARAARHAAGPLPEVAEPIAGPEEDLVWSDLRPVFDEEVGRLPAKFRVPFVLCYLEGRTNEQAAQELGWPRGTVATRLAAARRRLRLQLTRRGVVLSAGLFTVALTEQLSAAPAPAPLVLHTSSAALAFAANPGALTSLVTARVLSLTKGELRNMFLNKIKLVTAMLAVVALVILGLTTVAGSLLADGPALLPPDQGAGQPKPPQPAEAPAAGGRLLFYRSGQLTLIGPDGKGEKRVSKDRSKFMPGFSRLSPDGKRVAFLVQVEEKPPLGRDPRRKVYVRRLDEPEPGTDLETEAQMLSWSPDGQQLALTNVSGGDHLKTTNCVSWLVDLKTRKKTLLKIPANQIVTDWSYDGKYFLTSEIGGTEKEPTARLHLVSRDGAKDKVLRAPGQLAAFGRLSPDGRRVLYQAPDPQRAGKSRSASFGLFVLDIATGKATRLEGQPLNAELMGHCWSPDGRRIAYAWRQSDAAAGQQTESHLVVADLDGRNARTIASERGEFSALITIDEPDWR
jgi:RNA polymerase sigma factor (sigma-70 family)